MTIHPALRYSALRLLLFLGVCGVLALLQVRGILLVALAVLISGLLSYTLLSAQRDAMSEVVARRVERRRAAMAERMAAEDAVADELHRRQSEQAEQTERNGERDGQGSRRD